MHFRKIRKLWKKQILKIGRGEMICYSNEMMIQSTYRDCVAIVYKARLCLDNSDLTLDLQIIYHYTRYCFQAR